MIRKSFPKCGIWNKLDGSENDLAIIHGIEGYTLPKPDSRFYLESKDDASNDNEYIEECTYYQVEKDGSVKIADDEKWYIVVSVLFA